MTKVMQRLPALITVLAALSTSVVAQPPGLVVSVAASVYDALDEIAGLYRAATGVTVALNAGGSNALARQIVEGAKAGLFVSADESADGCGREGGPHRCRHAHAAPHQRARGDRARGSDVRFDAGAPARRPGRGALRWASPRRFLPASMAARWLEHQGAWPRLESKIVPFPDRARRAVGGRSGRVDAGIVYRTDAMASKDVRVVAQVLRERASVSRHCISRSGDRRATGSRTRDNFWSS